MRSKDAGYWDSGKTSFDNFYTYYMVVKLVLFKSSWQETFSKQKLKNLSTNF